MGKRAPEAPTPPDPNVVAAAQTQSNVQTATANARLSAVDQFGPSGSTVYLRRPDGTPYAQQVNLSPEMQQLFDGQTGVANQMVGTASDLLDRVPTGPMDLSGLPEMTGGLDVGGLPDLPGVGDFGAERERVEGAVYDRAMALMRPGMERDQARLQQRLADQGIATTSGAGSAELSRLDTSQAEARERAALSAVMAGGSEQSRLFGLASSARGQMFGERQSDAVFGNQARSQALAEALMLRNQPFNEASALIQGAPAMQQPGFMTAPGYNQATTNVAGIHQNAFGQQLAGWQAQQQANMAPWNGLLSLAGPAAYMFGKR